MEYIDNNVSYFKLVEQARLGDQESMNRLAELVEGRVFAYIYRLTLDYDLTQDLLQETLLGMVESLKDLKRADRFWPWLFRTAWGKVQHHFRQQRHERMVQISALEKERLLKHALQSSNDGLKDLIRRELSEAIVEAMENMKLEQRNILILRCFERMSYSEIAGFIGCKELRARVLFFRARHSLGWQLSHRGFGRQLLLIALGLLGLMTAPTEATAATTTTVTAASLEVGFLGTVVGAAGTKLGMAITATITAIVLTVTVKAVLITALYILLVLVCLVVADLCSR
ncbi:MAG: RNA polymerase sigma factor [Planctomycetota bacterium]